MFKQLKKLLSTSKQPRDVETSLDDKIRAFTIALLFEGQRSQEDEMSVHGKANSTLVEEYWQEAFLMWAELGMPTQHELQLDHCLDQQADEYLKENCIV
jgi:hypothetical protein